MSINVTREMLDAFRMHPQGCRCNHCGVIQTAIDDDDGMILNGHWLPPRLVEDRECLGLLLHLDKSRGTLRDTLTKLSPEALADLIKRCASGQLADMEEGQRLLVGMLATVCIIDWKHTQPE